MGGSRRILQAAQVAVISLFLAPLMVPVIKKITRIVEKDLKYFTHTMQYSTQPCWRQLYNSVLVDEGSSSILRLCGYTDDPSCFPEAQQSPRYLS